MAAVCLRSSPAEAPVSICAFSHTRFLFLSPPLSFCSLLQVCLTCVCGYLQMFGGLDEEHSIQIWLLVYSDPLCFSFFLFFFLFLSLALSLFLPPPPLLSLTVCMCVVMDCFHCLTPVLLEANCVVIICGLKLLFKPSMANFYHRRERTGTNF